MNRDYLKPQTILGWDVGVNSLGVAVVRFKPRGDELLLYHQITMNKHTNSVERFQQTMMFAKVQIRRALSYHVGKVGIEMPFVGRNMRTALQLAEIVGVIKCQCWQILSIPCERITPASAKKALTGSGRATKRGVMETVAMRWFDWTDANQPLPKLVREHASDAAAVCFAVSQN